MPKLIKKFISLILVGTLLVINIFTYVEARDIKLSIIYMLDAIEDMEYSERESIYKSEHESFITSEETKDNDVVDKSIEENKERQTNEKSYNKDESTAKESSDMEKSINKSSTPSEVEADEDSSELAEEPEADEAASNDQISEIEPEESSSEEVINPSHTASSSETDDKFPIEPDLATQSETDTQDNYVQDSEIIIATSSYIIEENLLGTSPIEEVFNLSVSGGRFSLKPITRKSSRGGQTFAGVLICGLTQASSKSTDRYSFVECPNPDRHQVEFKLYKEDEVLGDTLINTSIKTPGGNFLYPDYGVYGDYGEEKIYNVQSDIIPYNSSNFSLDTIYYATEVTSGCENTNNEELVDPTSTLVPQPLKNKHTGAKKYDTLDGSSTGQVNAIDGSIFLLYKVKLGDSLSKIAKHYGTTIEDIKTDNHFDKSMCYEGDILFIRDPGTEEPFENELSASELIALREAIDRLGYEKAMCEFGLEPVNMSTGDFYLEHTDVEVDEKGYNDFKLSRSYNSIGRKIRSDFGYGFNSIINDRIMVSSNGLIMHFASDGGGETYKRSEKGLYKSSKGHKILKAVKSADGDSYEDSEYDDDGGVDNPGDGNSVGSANNWQLISEDGSISTYDGYGNILTKADKHGNAYIYNYDSNYMLTSIRTPSGLSFGVSYNDKNLIDKITAPDGSIIKYEYDANKNLIKVTDQENRITRYEYDDDHKMISWYDSSNIRQVLNTYDSEGRVIKQVDANGNESTISYESGKTVVTNNLGDKEVYTLDEKLRTIGVGFENNGSIDYEYHRTFNENSKLVDYTDANGVTTSYTYDSNGNVIREDTTDGTYSINKTYTYDSRNNKTSETDYNGNTTTYEYDSKNNLIKVIDAKGNTIEQSYDASNRLIRKKDKNGNIESYRYTGSTDKPTEIEDSRGNITRFTYDIMHRVLSETDANGNISTTTYDLTGRKIKETDKRGNETKYTYSDRGLVLSIEDREGNVSTFTYDNIGNILSGSDGEGSTLTYEYDLKYNKIKEIDSLGSEKKYIYNVKGQVVEEIDATNVSKYYTLDGSGNILKEVDRNGNERSYKYNYVLNKIVEKIDERGKITRYTYDNNGNLIKEVKPDGSEINYEYDSLNQLIKVTNEIGLVTSFTYDANGNAIKKTIGENRIIEYTYDACNNLVEEKSPLNYINKIEYDPIGNIKRLIDENNYIIEYSYDGNSNITKVKDAEGNTAEYTYDKENRKVSYKDRNGHITRFSYDRAGRLVEKINTLNEKEEISYDANDNIIKETKYNADGSIYSEKENTYNTLNRLIEEKDAENHRTQYSYDNNGN